MGQASSIDYQGSAVGNGLSRSLWAEFDEMQRDKYHLYLDHFLRFPTQTDATDVGDWFTNIDTGCSCGPLASQQGGVMRLACDATGSDEEVAVTWRDSCQAVAMITTAGSNKKFWYESRVKLSATTSQSVYVGLAEENCPADGLLSDGGTGMDKDFIGFRILEADPDTFDAVYNTASGTETAATESAQDVVAATWYNLGMYYDGTKLYYFVDGTCLNWAGVAASADQMPDGEYLAPLFAIKQHEAVAKNLDVHFVAIGIEL